MVIIPQDPIFNREQPLSTFSSLLHDDFSPMSHERCASIQTSGVHLVVTVSISEMRLEGRLHVSLPGFSLSFKNVKAQMNCIRIQAHT